MRRRSFLGLEGDDVVGDAGADFGVAANDVGSNAGVHIGVYLGYVVVVVHGEAIEWHQPGG
jgi:hypothetical protein